jgi:hypothetical protein
MLGHAVACTAVAMQWPRDRRKNNGVMEPVSGQQLGKHFPTAKNTQATIEKRCFQCGLCREVITRTVGAISLELSSAREAEKRWRYN